MIEYLHPRRFVCRRLALIALLCSTCATSGTATEVAAAGQSSPQATTITGRTMGTTYSIKYWGEGAPPPDDAKRLAEDLLAEFDRQMSTYRDDSELAKFNRAGANEWIAVSVDTANVVQQAIQYGRLTDGAMDITVAPVLRRWHFGPTSRKVRGKRTAPTQPTLDQAMRHVGVNHVEARLAPPALRKDDPQTEIDLSSIAPGFAVDCVLEALNLKGVPNAIVDIGGEARAMGVRPDGKPWRVGIERASSTDAKLLRTISLDNLAVATAGDYRNSQVIDGVHYSHIVDPRTGRPLHYRGAAVTVLAESCIAADALDTGLLVMGVEDGYAWCVKHKVAALFQGEGGRKIRTTPRFDELIKASKSLSDER